MNNLSLRIKLSIIFVLFTLFIVTILGIQSTTTTRNNLLAQEFSDLEETAQFAANNLDLELDNQLNALRTEAQYSDFVEYLNLPSSQRAGSPEEIRAFNTLNILVRKDPVYISSYSIMNLRGTDVLDTFQSDIGVNKSDRDYFTGPLESGLPYISPIRVSQTTNEPSIYFSTPIRNNNGDIIGVLRVRFSAVFIQNLLISSFTSTQHIEEYAVLVDNDNFIRLAHTGDASLNYKAYADLTNEQVVQLQEELRLLPGAPEDVVVPQPEIIDGIQNLDNETVFTAPSIYDGAPAYTAGVRVQNTDWIVLIQHTERSALEPVQAQTQAIFISALVIMAVAATLGVLASLALSRPLTQLANAANNIAAGNLEDRVTIQSRDEIGALANSFNFMAERLQEILSNLENRVAERTKDMEISANVSRQLASILDPNQLAKEVVTQIQTTYDYYYTQIYLFDKAGENLVLTAGTGEAGAEMMKRGHSLPQGRGLVGRAAEGKKSVLVSDTAQAPDWLPNELLPNTKAEAAIPIILGEQVLGVLDVQDDVVNDITSDDITLLEALASQVAISIQNANSYARAEAALQEAQSLVDFAAEGIAILDLESGLWAEPNKNFAAIFGMSIEEMVTVGPGQMSPPNQPDGRESGEKATEMINTAMETGSHRFEWVHTTKDGTGFDCEIGLVRLPGDRPRLRQSLLDITERKNLQDLTAKRARQQESINTITQRIQAATTIEEAMQVAVRELGHAVGNRQTMVSLERPNRGNQNE